MKNKHIIYTLSAIPLTIALGNVNDSNAFFRLDSFIARNRTVSDVVDIKDNNLLKAINNQLGRGEVLSNVTVADMESLTILKAQERNISSIEGLEYAVNLREINLGSNKLINISSLSNLTNLKELHLSNNQISDISVLSNLTNLKYLHLGKNRISDMSVLENLTNLTNLTYLSLRDNQISDISVLSNLTNLNTLYLYNNQISDISVLENLTNLTNLRLDNNKIHDITPIKNLKKLTALNLSNQRPIIEAGDFKSEANALDISTNNPIIGLNNKNLNISSISNSGIYENGKLKWNIVPLGSHVRTFNFSENVTVGSASTTFNGTATLNFSVVDGGAPESDHTSDFDNSDFGIYATVTANDLGEGVSHLIHKGVRQSLPYRFKYDILEPANNIVEVYDLAGNKAEYEVKLKDSDIPTIEEGLDALVNKDSIEKEDISYFRTIINDLDESMNKDLLQDRLNDIYPNTLELERKSVTSNVDIYIKSENILQMSIDTNSIAFEDFSGVEDMTKENAVNITINSSLPYELNAYLPTEIQNSDKSNTMDKSILNIKENSESTYQVFVNTTDKVVLKDNCSAGNDLIHGIDIKLSGGISHEKDVYKTTIKFEAEQK